MYTQSHELVKSIRSAWRNLEILEKEAIRSFGSDDPVVEHIGYACTLSLANIPSLLKLLTFSHRPAKFSSMMKMLLKLILNILFGPQKDSDLALENLALRQQLAILKRHKKRPQIRTKDRLFWIMLCRFWSNWQEPLIVVKPETVIR